MTLGAVYCTHDACVFLPESVQRIYPVVDKIIFLVNFKPWCGDPIPDAVESTLSWILDMPDVDEKFYVVVGYWKDETEQRNAGLQVLRDLDVEWCLIVDDDELYNRGELSAVYHMLETDAIHAAYLFYHQIYWKDRETIIEGVFGSFPTLVCTDGTVKFNENRMILVNSGYTWFSLSSDMIMCHHMSFVRSDEDMLRKIRSFSHADDGLVPDWYERVWIGGDTSGDLHPAGGDRFKKAIQVTSSRYQLESFKKDTGNTANFHG